MHKEQLTKFKLPETPGVYLFKRGRSILYIGKATNLRSRVRSYFANDLGQKRSELVAAMVERATTIEWKETDSVLEALILEANLIKQYKPFHNTDAKDDKSFNYVVITKEPFPRVLAVRGKVLELEFPAKIRAYTFGPFPHGLQLQEALKLIRKIFPYRDTCTPSTKSCFNAHIGLCPGVCSGAITTKEYRDIVRHIVLLFKGKKKELLKNLEKEMKVAIKAEEFEQAAVLRRQVFALGHIRDVSLIKDEYRRPEGIQGQRIEAYDMAHLQGEANVGVMTVVEGGMANKNEYRKFKIKSASPGDDVGALREVLSRRLLHNEWPMPRLIVVDGSVAQIRAAKSVLEEYHMSIPIVGVVKDEKHRPREVKGDRILVKEFEKEILLANAEAHRFAIGYHRKKLRTRS